MLESTCYFWLFLRGKNHFFCFTRQLVSSRYFECCTHKKCSCSSVDTCYWTVQCKKLKTKFFVFNTVGTAHVAFVSTELASSFWPSWSAVYTEKNKKNFEKFSNLKCRRTVIKVSVILLTSLWNLWHRNFHINTLIKQQHVIRSSEFLVAFAKLRKVTIRCIMSLFRQSLCPPLSLSASLSVRQSLCPPVFLSASISVRHSFCPPVSLSASLSVRQSLWPPVSLSASLSVRQSLYPPVSLSAWNNSASTGRFFMQFEVFSTIFKKILVGLNSEKLTGTLREYLWKLVKISRWILVRMRNAFY